MYARVCVRALVHGALVLMVLVSTAWPTRGQSADPGAPAPDAQQHAGHDMAAMAGAGGTPMTRDASGTSWLPDESPIYALHHQSGGWMLMAHANGFLQYFKETGNRRSEQFVSINWLMGMAQHKAGAGRVTLRAMVSAEPWTIRGCGYPNLLASGEECGGEAIHDRQHPHDLFMEVAAEYQRPLSHGVRLQLYGGPAGEPALGPVAFVHRVSAMPNPLAPISHHWFDSTHVTYGVATAGLFSTKWKAEASVFNGREPDERRTNFDFAAMDSWSARLWVLPTSRWALQVSGGRLTEAEATHAGLPRVDVSRVTASATYHRATLENTFWATTMGWGRNAESGDATNALLLETSVTLHDRDAVYGRLEISEKTGHDLDLTPGHDVFTVSKVEGGYTRYLPGWKGWTAGVGAAVSGGIVPAALEPVYGRRFNPGFSVYLTLRPTAME